LLTKKEGAFVVPCAIEQITLHPKARLHLSLGTFVNFGVSIKANQKNLMAS